MRGLIDLTASTTSTLSHIKYAATHVGATGVLFLAPATQRHRR
jgi:hypothetical protein